MYYLYNAYLRYEGAVEHPDDAPRNCACTTDAPPPEPWPSGQWPYYLDAGWELVEVYQK